MGCAGSRPKDEEPTYQTTNPSPSPAASAEPARVANGDAQKEPEPAPEAAATLSAERLAVVQQIFNTWDFDGTGKVEIGSFKDTTVKIGPTGSHVLEYLNVMDFNSDGYVVAEEWEQYFAMTTTEHSDEEFKLMMDDIAEAASNAVTIIKCVRLAGAPVMATPAATEGAAEEVAEEEQEAATMSPARRAAVEELFKAWDSEGKGSISVLKLQKGTVAIGPTELHLFENLEAMDTDNDKEVTLSEMILYFTLVGEKMSEDEFEALRSEMLDLAQNEALIASLTALATTQVVPETRASEASGAAEEEQAEITPLSAARLALCAELFGIFAESQQTPIGLAELEADCAIDVGPVPENLFSTLRKADANDDGQLTFDEIRGYFTLVGATLKDDEFELILNEMIDSARAKAMLKAATQ